MDHVHYVHNAVVQFQFVTLNKGKKTNDTLAQCKYESFIHFYDNFTAMNYLVAECSNSDQKTFTTKSIK